MFLSNYYSFNYVLSFTGQLRSCYYNIKKIFLFNIKITKWLNLPHSLIFKRENFGSIVEGIYRKSNLPERFVQWPVPTYERAWCKQHQEQTRNTKCYSRRVICTRCCRCYEVSQRGNHIDEENTRVHCKRNMRPNERQHAFALS